MDANPTGTTDDDQHDRQGITRRAAVAGGAWALPVLALATTVPGASASACEPAPALPDLIGDAAQNSIFTGPTGTVPNVLSGATLTSDSLLTIQAWEAANAPLTILPATTTVSWPIVGYVQGLRSFGPGGPFGWMVLATQEITLSPVTVSIDALGQATFVLPQPDLDDFFDALRAEAALEKADQIAAGYVFAEEMFFYNPGYEGYPGSFDSAVVFSYDDGCELSQFAVNWYGA